MILKTRGLTVAGNVHLFSVIWLSADLPARAGMLNFKQVRVAVVAAVVVVAVVVVVVVLLLTQHEHELGLRAPLTPRVLLLAISRVPHPARCCAPDPRWCALFVCALSSSEVQAANSTAHAESALCCV